MTKEDIYIELHENVLTTDYIRGSTLYYYTYATEWSDREHIIEFKNTEQAIEWYEKHMRDRVVAQGKYWLEEDEGVVENITDEDAINEWKNIVDCVAYC